MRDLSPWGGRCFFAVTPGGDMFACSEFICRRVVSVRDVDAAAVGGKPRGKPPLPRPSGKRLVAIRAPGRTLAAYSANRWRSARSGGLPSPSSVVRLCRGASRSSGKPPECSPALERGQTQSAARRPVNSRANGIDGSFGAESCSAMTTSAATRDRSVRIRARSGVVQPGGLVSSGLCAAPCRLCCHPAY